MCSLPQCDKDFELWSAALVESNNKNMEQDVSVIGVY